MRSRTYLNNWHWRLANSNGQAQAGNKELAKWTSVSSFPSVIQQELVAKEIIPSYHIGENERQIQWVGACDWEYRTTFATPSKLLSNTDLVFEGLDTFATATLNGREILKSSNQFISARVEVRQILKPAGEINELVLFFESAVKAGARLEEKYGKRTSIMRDPKRNHTRKAQYSWGWDWGPIVITSGPWKPVYLDTYNNRIESVYIRTTKLIDDYKHAQIGIDVEVSHPEPNSQALITIQDAQGSEVSKISIPINEKTGSVQWTFASPKLWWPNQHGPPHLYTASVSLLSSSSSIEDENVSKFGIRTIEVIQRPLKDAPGTTFMFRVNGRDIFAQGGNWIPSDNLLPTVPRKRYFDWVKLGVAGNLNMIRVWGGGVYECDDFFDACDEHGVLVWHDYAFACGDYPTHEEFLDSVKEEAEVQTKRLRARASLALLAGGNEDFMIADQMSVPYDHSDTTGPFLDQPFPQREIYLSILPKIAERLAPATKYWPSSPWGGQSANDTTVGDIHQWAVWHLTQEPYQDYKKLAGRFVSEFGMHGFPVERTVEYFLRGTEGQHHPQSKAIDCHNKGHGAHTRIARYLAENFRFDMTNLSNFIYSSQLMQSEAYGYALRDWKRMFNGPGDERCAGAIIWQLNDVYPSTSWAYVDYFLRPKPAYYTIKRAYAELTIATKRTPNTRWIDEDNPRETEIPTFEIFAHNTGDETKVKLELRAYDFYDGAWTDLGDLASREVVLKTHQNTELGKLERQSSWTEESLIILELSLLDIKTSTVLARHVDWPEPFRYLRWPKDTSLSTKIEPAGDGWENKVTLVANQPLKGVWLEPVYDGSEMDDDQEPQWEDNMVDLMPGRKIIVRVNGLRGRKVKARFMCDWEIEE